MTVAVKQGDISDELAVRHSKLPEFIDGLVAELDGLFGDLLSTVLGHMVWSIDIAKDRMGRVASNTANVAAVFQLRRDRLFKDNLKRTVVQFRERIGRKIAILELQAYKLGLKDIAEVWNSNTPNGIKFKGVVTNADKKQLAAILIGGGLLSEWLDEYTELLQRKLLRAATIYTARPTGDEDGKRLLAKRLRRAVMGIAKQVKSLAEVAVNQANAIAYDNENELFADSDNWIVR